MPGHKMWLGRHVSSLRIGGLVDMMGAVLYRDAVWRWITCLRAAPKRI